LLITPPIISLNRNFKTQIAIFKYGFNPSSSERETKKPEQKVHPTVFSLKKLVKIIELVRGIIWRD